MMVTLLEQQVRLLEEERNQLGEQKAKLMVEVFEYKEMADKMAVSIKNIDKSREDECCEQDDYIEQLESHLNRYEDQAEDQD